MTPLARASESGDCLPQPSRIRRLLSHDSAFLPSQRHPHDSTSLSQLPLSFNISIANAEDLRSKVRVVGFDEAGRGALAGPVTVACVRFDWNDICTIHGEFRSAILETYADLNDSKQVAPRIRERLSRCIQAEAAYGIGCASAMEIDRMGIVNACQLAASRALKRLVSSEWNRSPRSSLTSGADIGLFDRGLSLAECDTKAAFSSLVTLTKGDSLSFHIAAASILAKVWRDAWMCSLAARAEAHGAAEGRNSAEPYGFARHKGYGSAAHIAAIRQHGPSQFHRQTFLTRI